MNNISKILIVEDDPKIVELLIKYIKSLGYLCDISENGYEGLRKIQNNDYDLVLSDIKMPIMDGFEMIRQIRIMNTSLPVVVIMSSHNEKIIMRDAIRTGVQDYIFKPINLEEMEIAIIKGLTHNRLIRENIDYKLNLENKVEEQTVKLFNQYRELESAYQLLKKSWETTINALCSALEARDKKTEHHVQRVQDYVIEIAKIMNFTDKEIDNLKWGARLHDIGKIGIPDNILLKSGELTFAEWDIMKRHPLIAYEILKEIDFLKDVLPIILYHHERYDGTGYPVGLKNDEIPIGARIFAVTDAYDAMTTDRPYRKAMKKEDAMVEINRCAGTQFDPHIVKLFLNIIELKKSNAQ